MSMSSDSAALATILVVDDNDMNRDMLSRRLEHEGYQASLASDGYMALDLLASDDINIDLVLLDIMMPQLDGYQVLERIKGDSRLHSIPVIMITAFDEIDSTVKCIEL